MPNQTFNFNSNVKTFDINGDPNRTISFEPTSYAFIKKLYNSLEECEAGYDGFKKELTAAKPDGKFAVMDAYEEKIRSTIDGAFPAPVCSAILGDNSVFDIVDGMPQWFNLVLSIIELCDKEMAASARKTNPRFDKLMKKYSKRK